MKKILLSSLIAVMAVSAANAKIASTDYADAIATTKANAAEAAAISAAATDAKTKADAAEAAANSYTDGQIDTLTKGAIKSNADAIAGIKEDMKTVATNETVENIQNTLNKLDGTDTTEGSVRQLIKAANDAQDTTLKAYADQAEADAITTAGNNATTAISNALKDYSTTNTIASTYAPISTTYTKDEVNSLVNVKANSADVYTKSDIDTVLGATGTTGKAIAAAQATADGAVSVNTAQATAIENLQAADETINEKFGNLGDKTVAQAIADAKTEATYSDAEVRGLISANTTEIGKINSSAAMTSGIDSTKVGQIATNTTNIGTNTTAIATLTGTGDGSVSQAVADGIAGITASVADGNGAIATLTQADGKVSVTRKLVATTDLNESVNSALTNANDAAAFMLSVQGASTDQTQANKAYVLTASTGTDGKMTYTWEEIDRSLLN